MSKSTQGVHFEDVVASLVLNKQASSEVNLQETEAQYEGTDNGHLTSDHSEKEHGKRHSRRSTVRRRVKSQLLQALKEPKIPRRLSRAQILREDHIRAVISEEKAKIEDDQSKVPPLPKPPTLRKVDRTPIIIEAMLKRRITRIREVLAQRKAEKYIKETLTAWKGDLKSDYSDRIDIEEYRRMSTRRSTVPRKIFGRIRLSQFRSRLKTNESEESCENESTNRRDQRYSQSKVIESIQSRSSRSMNRSFDREMWHRHVANQSEDVDESTNQRRSRRMYRKLFRPSRRRTTRTFNTEQFQALSKEQSKDDLGQEKSVENVRSDFTKYKELEYVRIHEHERSEDPDVPMNRNSEHNQRAIHEQEKEHTRGRSLVRKTADQRKTTEPGEQKSSEKVRRNIDQKIPNNRLSRRISSKIKSREEYLVKQNQNQDEQIEKKMKNVRKQIKKSNELLNRNNDSIEKTSEQRFDKVVNSEAIHHGSDHIQVFHEQIKQKGEQNVRHPIKESNEQNIIESSNMTTQFSSIRRDSGEQLSQEQIRKNSEQKVDNYTEQNKCQRISSIRCISPKSSSVLVNTNSSIEQKRIERSTKTSNNKQTSKEKNTKQKITKHSEQINSKHVLAGPIEQKEGLRKQKSRTKKNEQYREQFEIRIIDSDSDIVESEHVPDSYIEQLRSSEEQCCEQNSSEKFKSFNQLDIESSEQERSSKERHGNRKFASNADDELDCVSSIVQKQSSKERTKQLKKEKSHEQSRSERLNSELELETEEVPFVVPENVPLDVPFYVYSYNSGLTAEPTLSDIYLPSDFSFDDMTEESQNELLQALEEDSSHLLSELLHLTSSEDFILSQTIDRVPRKKLSRVYSTCYRLARKARPRRTTSRNNANLVYQDVINATKENLNQSVFTNEIVGRGVQRLVDKEKKGLVQREEELPVYDGQPAVKKMTYGLSIGLLLYSLYKINSI